MPDTPKIRTGAELRKKFGAREKAILDRMQAAVQAKHGPRPPSKDRRRALAIASGEIVIHPEDGTEVYRMSPELADLLALREEMFEYKFGRPMGPKDHYFFDENSDDPTSVPDDDEFIAAFRNAAMEVGRDPDEAVEFFFGRDVRHDMIRKRQ